MGIIACAEPPDFIVRAGTDLIGMEITRYPYTHLNDVARKARRQEAEWDKAVQNAGTAYISRNPVPIDVGVTFNPHFDVTRKRRKILEDIMLDLVVKNLPDMGMVVSLRHQGRIGDSIPPEIRSIIIARFDTLTRSHWAVQHVGYMKSFVPSEFIQILREKEGKLRRYRDTVTQAWLICVIEGLRPSSFAEISRSFVNTVYSTKFDKLMLLEYFDKKVTELKIQMHAD